MDKKTIRTAQLQTRLALPQSEQIFAAKKMSHWAMQCPWLINAQKLGLYFGFRAEISCNFLVHYALANNKSCYFPKINTKQGFKFVRYLPQSRLRKNHYGILEPHNNVVLSLTDLDCMFLPLLAFDQNGSRLGYGAGYYDRQLAELSDVVSKPKLIGLAYSWQELDIFPSFAWDRQLDAVVTDKGIQYFN